MREIGLSFFSFNLLHYLESVILNTTTLTMTTMQSTVKRADSEQYNDIAIIIKIIKNFYETNCMFPIQHSQYVTMLIDCVIKL
jgi:sensor c-di-GMP phosphodiesterase-like protein